MNKFTLTTLASIFTFSASGASAAAFQLAEISTSGLGLAYAGNAAVIDNASVVATNAALMTKFKQINLAIGGILVDADIDIYGKLTNGQDASHKNIVPNAIVPNAYIVSPINRRFSVGGGVNVNYGLKSEFDPNYSAGFFGGKTDLAAVNINLSGAYKLAYGFSIGLGINAVHAKATLERYLGNAVELAQAKIQDAKTKLEQVEVGLAQINAIPAPKQNTPEIQTKLRQLQGYQSAILGQLAASNIKVSNSAQLGSMLTKLEHLNQATNEGNTIHKLKGDKWGFGWNVGLLYEINENNRLGFAYHSPIKISFKGQYSNTIPVAISGIVDTVTGGASIPGALKLTLPSFWEISGYHKLTDRLAVNYSYKRTNWSSFKSLNAYNSEGGELFHKDENFNDASRIALGFSYDVNEALTVRTGVAYDESASVTSPSISIPDTDRTWYSLGATYRFTPNLAADIGYSYIKGSKNDFNEEGRGQFSAHSKAQLIGLNLNYKF